MMINLSLLVFGHVRALCLCPTDETQATIRNIPFGFEQAPGVPCIKCNGPAVVTAWFAKAY